MRGRYKTGKYKKCQNCGKDFYCSPSRIETATFCSISCSAKWRYKEGEMGHLNRGFTYTEEHKKKVSDKMKEHWKTHKHPRKGKPSWLSGTKGQGLIQSWSKGKKLPQFSGENHPNWKGGKTKKSEKIRKSPEYRQWRESVFKRDKWICQECGKVGGQLVAHHIKSFRNFPDLAFNSDNGLTLCKECHYKTDNYAEKAILNPAI